MSLIISKHHKYIFFHIPKNAGVSVSRALSSQEKSLQVKRISSFFFRKVFNTRDNFYISIKEKKFFFFKSHIPCYEFFKFFTEKKFDNFLKFALITNPWDRMVSRYFYSKKINSKFKNYTFKEFLNYDLEKNMHVINQFKFCTDTTGKFCLDKIIKFENLNNDFNDITKKFFNKKDMLIHLNRSSHQNYREYYDKDTKDKIYKFCKDDIEFFDYEF